MIYPLSSNELYSRAQERKLSVATHSGAVTEGGVFVVMPAAVPRGREDSVPGGEAHLAKALEARPGVVVCAPRHLPLLESLLASMGRNGEGRENSPAVCVTDAPRVVLGELASIHFGTGLHCPKVIGITGTNGKTTESYLLEALFTAVGYKAGVVGTVNYRWPGHVEDAPLTTPGCLQLHEMLAKMHAVGVDVAVMEVSSHALEQERVAGIPFSAALLTNVTQDHLDYHGNMEEYFEAKARLFAPVSEGGAPLDGKASACNSDDAFARRVLAETRGSVGFGLHKPFVPGSRHLRGEIISMTPAGIHMVMHFEGRSWELKSPLVGSFNAMNLLGAQAVGLAMDLPVESFTALESFSGVPGRLERVPSPSGRNVFVDYAHTPDALVKAIGALRAAGFARIVTVFGCGGNRDRTKRPLMGEAVARLTDVAVLTSDNPRHEEPEAIIADVLPGLARCPQVVVQADRRLALKQALALAGPEDALLVAGKGHETYQQIRDVKIPFSDQAILRELMS